MPRTLRQVLGCLNHILYGLENSVAGLSEALADLRAYSGGLMDWVLGKSLIEKGVWPLRQCCSSAKKL